MNVRDSIGKITYCVHYACDVTGEDQPAFRGFFRHNGKRFVEVVDVVEWQPYFAKNNPKRNDSD